MRTHRSLLVELRDNVSKAGQQYIELEDIDDPRAKRAAHIGKAVVKIGDILAEYLENEDDYLALLGADTPERYIVLNQNRDEIRTN